MLSTMGLSKIGRRGDNVFKHTMVFRGLVLNLILLCGLVVPNTQNYLFVLFRSP